MNAIAQTLNDLDIHAIVGTDYRTFDYIRPRAQDNQAIWPLLNQHGGRIPTAPKATFEIAISPQSAQAYFYHSGELIAVAAITLAPGEESTSLWAWITGALNATGEQVNLALPTSRTWIAISIAEHMPAIAGEDAYELTESIPLVVRSMVPWLAQRN